MLADLCRSTPEIIDASSVILHFIKNEKYRITGVTVVDPFSDVVVCRDGSLARIVAPDPRWFALQKLWMSEQAKRNALKRPKDLKQGIALLDAVHLTMPQYPIDADFRASLPEDLVELFGRWAAQRPKPASSSW